MGTAEVWNSCSPLSRMHPSMAGSSRTTYADALPHREDLLRVIILHRSAESRLTACNMCCFSTLLYTCSEKRCVNTELCVGETWTYDLERSLPKMLLAGICHSRRCWKMYSFSIFYNVYYTWFLTFCQELFYAVLLKVWLVCNFVGKRVPHSLLGLGSYYF